MLYRKDADAVRDRLSRWWKDENIGRPAMVLVAKREKPLEDIPVMPKPEGWTTDSLADNLEYRLNILARTCNNSYYLGDAIPAAIPKIGTNALAQYLGCQAYAKSCTVWCEPYLEDYDGAEFNFNPDNYYWRFTRELIGKGLPLIKGKFMLQFPDLVEGLDILSAMRGPEQLNMDLLENPEAVKSAVEKITESYFIYYDKIYEMIKDESGGSYFWSWAPGRIAKLQCDFSIMISPAMFDEFMQPVLEKMTRRVDFCIYHLDGAVQHLDTLLKIDGIDMIQWEPGSLTERPMCPKWFPIYRKIIDGGKKVYLSTFKGLDNLRILKKEFKNDINRFMIKMPWLESPDEADEALDIVS